MKLRRWLVFLGLAAVAAGYSLAWAWDGYFASLHPLDLATAARTSPEVLDRDGSCCAPSRCRMAVGACR